MSLDLAASHDMCVGAQVGLDGVAEPGGGLRWRHSLGGPQRGATVPQNVRPERLDAGVVAGCFQGVVDGVPVDRPRGFEGFPQPPGKWRPPGLLQAATRAKRTAVVVELDPERDAAPIRDDGGLGEALASMHVLSDREREALAAHLNGKPVDDNALWRARRKLRAAA